MKLISIFLSAFLVENVVLTKFLGLCPFLGTSNTKKNAISMGLSVTTVTVLSSIITYLIYYLILEPTNSTYLTNTMFIFVIASNVQILETIIKKKNKKLYENLGIYLPLITTNCAVLGINLLNISNNYNLIEAIIYSLGSSLGFTFILYLFSTIREELDKKEINNNYKGVPLALITIAIMAMLFARFTIEWLL